MPNWVISSVVERFVHIEDAGSSNLSSPTTTASRRSSSSTWLRVCCISSPWLRFTFLVKFFFRFCASSDFGVSEGCNRGLHGSACIAPLKHRRIDGRGGGKAFSRCPRARRRVHAAKVCQEPERLVRGQGIGGAVRRGALDPDLLRRGFPLTESDLHPRPTPCLRIRGRRAGANAGQKQTKAVDGLDRGAVERRAGCSCRRRSEAVAACIRIYEANADRMRYDLYKKLELLIGFGVVESACKQIVSSRFKRAGCHWLKAGANALLAVKFCLKNNRWTGFLDWRACSAAAA